MQPTISTPQPDSSYPSWIGHVRARSTSEELQRKTADGAVVVYNEGAEDL